MYYKRNKNVEQICTITNNDSYAIWVSEVFEHFILPRKLVSVDTNATPQSNNFGWY